MGRERRHEGLGVATRVIKWCLFLRESCPSPPAPSVTRLPLGLLHEHSHLTFTHIQRNRHGAGRQMRGAEVEKEQVSQSGTAGGRGWAATYYSGFIVVGLDRTLGFRFSESSQW